MNKLSNSCPNCLFSEEILVFYLFISVERVNAKKGFKGCVNFLGDKNSYQETYARSSYSACVPT